ncbi:MAG TPA: phosphoribosylaminoimidazolesuccinocarboxamide synthase [Gemmata sp.]
MPDEPLFKSSVPGYTVRAGKVRDVYDLGDALVIVATDRISAFDWVLPTPIPGKGKVLTAMTLFWLKWLNIPNHFLSARLSDLPAAFQREELGGRTMLVKKAAVVPVECVARGYLLGTGWKEYQRHGTVCGITLPPGLPLASKLPEPLFTPATKAEDGAHDENISFEVMAGAVGAETATELRAKTLDVYRRAAAHAESRGIILADTKLEWGRLPNGELILVDEVLTPDSSRYWPKDQYRAGESPVSFDKQFVRDWLESADWDKSSPPPALPEAVVNLSADKYREALDRLTT